MSAKLYISDSGGATRFPKKVYSADSGGTSRFTKKIYVSDSGGVSRLVYTGADYLSLVAGGTTGVAGYVSASFGTLTPHVLGDGATVTELAAATTTGHSLILSITGYTGTITSAYLLSLTLNSTTLLATAASFSGGASGGSANWQWTPGFNLVSGDTYAITVQRSA